jgi:hypothetical protein
MIEHLVEDSQQTSHLHRVPAFRKAFTVPPFSDDLWSATACRRFVTAGLSIK